MGAPKKAKVPARVATAAKALAQVRSAPVKAPATEKNEKKAKLVAALKRLHPMD